MKYGIYYAYWAKEWGGDYAPYVERVKKLGFDILEISCASVPYMSREEIDTLKRAKDEHGIIITGGYGPKPSENIASADPAIVANTIEFWKKTFPVLHELGVTIVGGGLYSYWPVDYSKPIDKAADWDRSVKGMRIMADMAAEYGINLGMEVLNRHEGYLLNEASEGVRYVEEVGKPNVKVMLDTYHMNMEEESIEEAILLAGDKLGHLHIGEVNHRLPGAYGRVPWQGIADALKKIKYDGAVVMEPFVMMGGQVGADIKVWRDLTHGRDLDEAAAESVQFIRNIFEKKI